MDGKNLGNAELNPPYTTEAHSKTRTALEFPRYLVDRVWFSRTDYSNVVASLEAFFSDKQVNNFVCVSNVHTTVECRSDERLLSIQNGSFLTIADGQPIIYYGKLLGIRNIARIMGPDLMTEVFSNPVARARRHFFLGGTPETLTAMKLNLRTKFPGLCIAGMLSPPFRKMQLEEEDSMFQTINTNEPDYLWVCFGAPKQEYWMESNHNRFPSTLLIGIGAGFAYHAGELRRAPIWAQRFACEWIWRLIQDPKRLWKRYLKSNPIFVLLFFKRAMVKLFLRR